MNKKFSKVVFFVVVLSFFAGNGIFAEDTYLSTYQPEIKLNEIQLRMGILSVESFTFLALAPLFLLPSSLSDNSPKNTVFYFPTASIEYMRYVSSRSSIGGVMTVGVPYYTLYKNNDENVINTISLMFKYKINLWEGNGIKFYESFALGASFLNTFSTISATGKTTYAGFNVLPAFQWYNGLQFGGNSFYGTVELGLGTEGLIAFGMGYRF